MTCKVFLSEHAQRDLDTFSDKVIKQILADCARLADDPIPDGKRIKKLQGYKENLLPAGSGRLSGCVQPVRDPHRHRTRPEQARLSEGVLTCININTLHR